MALEGALKLKEISYIHAEGYAAGELKHGPIALIDENTPVIILAPRDELYEKTMSNMQEVAARGGKVILLTSENGGGERQACPRSAAAQRPSVRHARSSTLVPIQLAGVSHRRGDGHRRGSAAQSGEVRHRGIGPQATLHPRVRRSSAPNRTPFERVFARGQLPHITSFLWRRFAGMRIPQNRVEPLGGGRHRQNSLIVTLQCSHIVTTVISRNHHLRREAMSAADTYVRARIDTDTKERAARALDAMGLSISDAIRLLMLRIADEQRLPFDVKAPNATTRQALAELEAGKGEKFASVDDLMADLHADD